MAASRRILRPRSVTGGGERAASVVNVPPPRRPRAGISVGDDLLQGVGTLAPCPGDAGQRARPTDDAPTGLRGPSRPTWVHSELRSFVAPRRTPAGRPGNGNRHRAAPRGAATLLVLVAFGPSAVHRAPLPPRWSPIPSSRSGSRWRSPERGDQVTGASAVDRTVGSGVVVSPTGDHAPDPLRRHRSWSSRTRDPLASPSSWGATRRPTSRCSRPGAACGWPARVVNRRHREPCRQCETGRRQLDVVSDHPGDTTGTGI
jgi:hypothetical protein